jgi:hypothetical protein
MQQTLCFKEKFTGSRIYIRLLTEADADALLKFRIANRAFLRPFEGLQTDEQFTEEYVRNLLVKWMAEKEADSTYAFGIDRETEELMGTVRLSGIIRGVFQNALLSRSFAVSLRLYRKAVLHIRRLLDHCLPLPLRHNVDDRFDGDAFEIELRNVVQRNPFGDDAFQHVGILLVHLFQPVKSCFKIFARRVHRSEHAFVFEHHAHVYGIRRDLQLAVSRGDAQQRKYAVRPQHGHPFKSKRTVPGAFENQVDPFAEPIDVFRKARRSSACRSLRSLPGSRRRMARLPVMGAAAFHQPRLRPVLRRQ